MLSDVTALIGRTPMVALSPNLLAKLEGANPGGSVKDRIALGMIEDAERKGLLEPGGLMVEPTSGNTGIGLALVSAVRGYRLILTMPDTMSTERRTILSALGASLELTPGSGGMEAALTRAREIARETGAFMPGQFDNPANPGTHRATTAQEIWMSTEGTVDVLVAGVGTGGTITGVSRALKARKPSFRAVAVEPGASPVLSGGQPGTHCIDGIGPGFVPSVYDPSVVDAVRTVTDDEARESARWLAREHGLLAGMSSGAACHVAREIAGKDPEKVVVVILPDTGERYLSSGLYGGA